MTILSRLKDWLGLGRSRREVGGTEVPVEREPAAQNERAVKGSPPPSAPTPEPDAPAEEAPEPAVDVPPTEADAGSGSTEPVDSLDGIGSAYADRLGEAGVETVADLAAADAADLAERTGLGEGRIAGWIERARWS